MLRILKIGTFVYTLYLSIFFINRAGYKQGYKEGVEDATVSVVKEIESEVDMVWIVPCYKNGECIDTNIDYYIEEAEIYWKNYGVGLEIDKKYITFEEELYLRMPDSSIDPLSNIEFGKTLGEELRVIGGEVETYIINAPIYQDIYGTLGYAYIREQIVVIGQHTLNNWRYNKEEKAEVVIHEIGHLFGLEDIYTEGTCNIMYGHLKVSKAECRVLTEEQVEQVHNFIETFVNVYYE